jgi:hypothetical protein
LLVYEQFFAVMSLKEKASVVAGDSRERLAFHSFQLVSFCTDAAYSLVVKMSTQLLSESVPWLNDALDCYDNYLY